MSDNRSTAAILRRALQVIEDPARWTTGAMARNSAGYEVKPRSRAASSWCALGALRVATLDLDKRFAAETELDSWADGSIVLFNDLHSHDDVLAVFFCAIDGMPPE